MGAAKKVQQVMTVDAARKEFNDFMGAMQKAFPERDDEIRSLALALLAREHVVLVGPPGTAKSMLTRTFANALEASFFDILMSKYTSPDELFGPYSIQKIKEDRLSRITACRLPEAQFAFLDEGFKANGACLNSLLSAVNERIFHDDGQVKDIPLELAVIASNELPHADENLSAFDDRFILRHKVEPLRRKANMSKLMQGKLGQVNKTISWEAVEILRDAADDVKISDSVVNNLVEIKAKLFATDGDKDQIEIYVSDRKLGKICKVLRAHAVLNGAQKVVSADLKLLNHMAWRAFDEMEKVKRVIEETAFAWEKELREAKAAVSSLEKQLKPLLKDKITDKSKPKLMKDLMKIGQQLQEVRGTFMDKAYDEDMAQDELEDLKARMQKIQDDGKAKVKELQEAAF